MRHVSTYLHWLTLLALVAVVVLLLPSRVEAQQRALQVTLHDPSGQGLAGISVLVRAEDGQLLQQTTTDASGTAVFADLLAVVRVAVDGQPRNGPRLYQLGDDANGMRLDLGQGDDPVVLNLRVERDGLVLPDPATMLTLEEGGPVVGTAPAIATAVLATPAPLPTTASSAVPVAVGDDATPQTSAPRRDGWVPWVTVLIVALAAGVLRLLQQRRAAQ